MVVLTGNKLLGQDFGEGAWELKPERETTTTSKEEGSRYASHPILTREVVTINNNYAAGPLQVLQLDEKFKYFIEYYQFVRGQVLCQQRSRSNPSP